MPAAAASCCTRAASAAAASAASSRCRMPSWPQRGGVGVQNTSPQLASQPRL